MGRKQILERRKQRLEARRQKLIERSNASENIAEVREINEQLTQIAEDLQDITDEITSLVEGDEGDEGDEGGEGDNGAGEGAVEGRSNFNPMATFSTVNNAQQRANIPALDSIEYRQAFADYVRTGKWNYEARANETLLTSDVGKIIPNTIMNEFIKELKVYGQLYSKVRKLNVRGGVEFPIEELVPTVTWITETTVSETKKAPEIKNSIAFAYHIVEARISQSLLSQIVTLEYLESEIAKLLAEAFVKEFDRVIVAGSGNGQPLGILKDTRVKATNKIAFTAADMADWTKYRTKLFAKIPLAYRGQGEFIMTPNTWETHIMTLKDANNNPLYSETYDPVTGEQICRFAGRHVTFVESDILADYDTAESGGTWGIYLRPQDYAINSQLQIGFKRYFNDDTNKWTNKGLCIMDGKLLDVNGVYLLQK